MDQWDVVVAGAGIAGVSAVRTIAQQNGGRRVLLINGEDIPPYKRTKLSKQIASGFSPRVWTTIWRSPSTTTPFALSWIATWGPTRRSRGPADADLRRAPQRTRKEAVATGVPPRKT